MYALWETIYFKGTLGMKNERILRHLLEMIDLDSSEYVRLMVRNLSMAPFCQAIFSFIPCLK